MNITLHPSFKKAYKKRITKNPQLIAKVVNRIALFRENPDHPLIRNHQLTGAKREFKAFSVTGDVRIIYRLVDDTLAQFVDIGTHNQVY